MGQRPSVTRAQAIQQGKPDVSWIEFEDFFGRRYEPTEHVSTVQEVGKGGGLIDGHTARRGKPTRQSRRETTGHDVIDWCASCDRVVESRYMRWYFESYGCLECLEGVGIPVVDFKPVVVSPWDGLGCDSWAN